VVIDIMPLILSKELNIHRYLSNTSCFNRNVQFTSKKIAFVT